MYNGISRSFVLGYLLGLAGLPVKTAPGAAAPPTGDRETPAMFYYNGLGPLPALPEGYENFPCATIGKLDDAISLHLSDVPFFARVNASGTYNLANLYKDIGVKFHMFRLLQNGIWDDYGVDILGINRVLFGGLTDSWANYDMLDQNGNIHIRKTAPIPVIGGTENPIAPSVFLAGLRFGTFFRHYGKQPTIPAGVLISSDGYILQDSNGLYLIAKEDS